MLWPQQKRLRLHSTLPLRSWSPCRWSRRLRWWPRRQDRVELELIDTPVSQVLNFLSERHRIPISPDEAALTEAGVGLDTEVNFIISGVTLENALSLILRPLDLDFVVRNEVLEITTRGAAEALTETRVYPVAGQDEGVSAEDLARIIQRTVRPESWETIGAIEPVQDKLVITHNQRVHREIEELLAKLNQTKGEAAPTTKVDATIEADPATSAK
jgi:hypothetical protein